MLPRLINEILGTLTSNALCFLRPFFASLNSVIFSYVTVFSNVCFVIYVIIKKNKVLKINAKFCTAKA